MMAIVLIMTEVPPEKPFTYPTLQVCEECGLVLRVGRDSGKVRRNLPSHNKLLLINQMGVARIALVAKSADGAHATGRSMPMDIGKKQRPDNYLCHNIGLHKRRRKRCLRLKISDSLSDL
jgi:hypothetical protein